MCVTSVVASKYNGMRSERIRFTPFGQLAYEAILHPISDSILVPDESASPVWIGNYLIIGTNVERGSGKVVEKVLDESRSFFRVHTGYFSNIPKCIKAEFIASWACSQSSVVSSSQR
ncbi:hypothetical protein TNCV_2832351 [Trichonephila clavipes]|nr:hypothetical protein TNCV_2832351 [Trichonephila clavipes]